MGSGGFSMLNSTGNGTVSFHLTEHPAPEPLEVGYILRLEGARALLDAQVEDGRREHGAMIDNCPKILRTSI